jgi:translation elongation factor EF-4
MLTLFDIDPSTVIHASAKTGVGISEILDAVIERVPPPNRHGKSTDLRMLLQDSWYDKYKGAVNLVQVVDGVLKLNMAVTSVLTKKSYVVKTLGILTPFETPIKALYPGQVCNSSI